MPRKTAGKRYPFATTDARPHDHSLCRVVGKIAERAARGDEPWGTVHRMPPVPGEEQAADIRRRLFLGRDCKALARQHGELSVQVRYLGEDGEAGNSPARRPEGYVLAVAVWPRDRGKAEIARRVNDGESLHYNVLREQ